MNKWILPLASVLITTSVFAADDISAARRRASDLFLAVTGLKVSIDDARIIKMEQLIAQNKEAEAVKVATDDAAFYDIRLQNMAKKMSTREETLAAPLSDFVATFVGAVRDDVDARQLLTGNFYYKFNITNLTGNDKTTMDKDPVPLADRNNHYSSAQNLRLSLKTYLEQASPQLVVDEKAMPDAAGLLTTRGFVSAHALAGTNRRMVEFTFREFMCVTMQDWMDVTRPDDYVGRDVDRFAGGGNTRYQQTCKGCHAQMDAFRQAFAFIDWNGSAITYTPDKVVGKYSRNSNIFPRGNTTVSNNWMNYATGSSNADRFGWRAQKLTGNGMNEFGQMIANSKGFSRCMSRKFFTEICKRDPSVDDEKLVRSIASDFEQSYKLKTLAEKIAIHPACLTRKAQ
jgi:hypothetical protein